MDFRVLLALRLLHGLDFAGHFPMFVILGDLYENPRKATAQCFRITTVGLVSSEFPCALVDSSLRAGSNRSSRSR